MLDFKPFFREAGTDLPNPLPSREFQKLLDLKGRRCERQRKGDGKEVKCYRLHGVFWGNRQTMVCVDFFFEE